MIWELTQRAFSRREEISREELVAEIEKIRNSLADVLYDYSDRLKRGNRDRARKIIFEKNCGNAAFTESAESLPFPRREHFPDHVNQVSSAAAFPHGFRTSKDFPAKFFP